MENKKLSSHLNCCKVVDLHSRIYRYEVLTRYYRYRFIRKSDADKFARQRNQLLTDSFRIVFETFGRFSVQFTLLSKAYRKELTLLFNQLNLIELYRHFEKHEQAISIACDCLFVLLQALPSSRSVSNAFRDIKALNESVFIRQTEFSGDSAYIVIPRKIS